MEPGTMTRLEVHIKFPMNVLELWRNIGLQLPKADNIQVCFREVFLRGTGPKNGQTYSTGSQRGPASTSEFFFSLPEARITSLRITRYRAARP